MAVSGWLSLGRTYPKSAQEKFSYMSFLSTSYLKATSSYLLARPSFHLLKIGQRSEQSWPGKFKKKEIVQDFCFSHSETLLLNSSFFNFYSSEFLQSLLSYDFPTVSTHQDFIKASCFPIRERVKQVMHHSVALWGAQATWLKAEQELDQRVASSSSLPNDSKKGASSRKSQWKVWFSFYRNVFPWRTWKTLCDGKISVCNDHVWITKHYCFCMGNSFIETSKWCVSTKPECYSIF